MIKTELVSEKGEVYGEVYWVVLTFAKAPNIYKLNSLSAKISLINKRLKTIHEAFLVEIYTKHKAN